jgi:hypothetical protein
MQSSLYYYHWDKYVTILKKGLYTVTALLCFCCSPTNFGFSKQQDIMCKKSKECFAEIRALIYKKSIRF